MPTEPTDAAGDRDAELVARARETARACIDAGIEAADPEAVVAASLTLKDGRLRIDGSDSAGTSWGTTAGTDSEAEAIDLDAFERVLVFGGGNAAGRVAAGLERVLGDRIDDGIVVTDATTETTRIEQLPGDHPVPSDRGIESTRRLLEEAKETDEDTLVLAPITGGGSALMVAPAPGIDLADMQSVTEALLGSGAPIEDVNAVRKHLSDLKGGQLAAALAPSRVVSLVFSDVVGNRLDTIASGPTVPDTTSYEDALDVLDRYEVDTPGAILERLRAGAQGDYAETPTVDHPVFERTRVHILADNLTACAAARTTAENRGYDVLVLTTRVTGPARDAASWHAGIAHEITESGNPLDPPAVIITGGETTVRVTESGGRGGPNHEFALAAALDLPQGAVLGAVDTDGVDGNTDAAGAIVDDDTIDDRGAAMNAMDSNDSHPYLQAREAVVETGVTGTNVNDLRVLVVESVRD